MPLNMTPLQTVLQSKIDALGPNADEKTLLLLSKTIESAAGNASVSDIIGRAATEITGINTAGATQVGNVNAAGADKIAAIQAVDALLKTGGSMTGVLVGSVGVLTDGATITLDLGQRNNFELTTSGNRTMANPANATKGQEGTIEIIGAPVMSWGSAWKFPNGILPTFTGRSLILYRVASASLIEALVVPNFS